MPRSIEDGCSKIGLNEYLMILDIWDMKWIQTKSICSLNTLNFVLRSFKRTGEDLRFDSNITLWSTNEFKVKRRF